MASIAKQGARGLFNWSMGEMAGDCMHAFSHLTLGVSDEQPAARGGEGRHRRAGKCHTREQGAGAAVPHAHRRLPRVIGRRRSAPRVMEEEGCATSSGGKAQVEEGEGEGE